jgi:hypothetical protein
MKYIESPLKCLTVGDAYRDYNNTMVKKKENYQQSIIIHLLYRSFVTPIDVSSRWYQYYYYNDKKQFTDINQPRNKHPANIIANWAYVDRFPYIYLSTAMANSSIDADSYARFGIIGIIISSIIIVLMFLWMYFFYTNSVISRLIFICFIILMSILLPQASIQAILVAHGISILMLFQLLQYFLVKRWPAPLKLE